MSDTLTQAGDAHLQGLRKAVEQNAGLLNVQAVLLVVAGVVALVYPLVTTAALALFLGWVLVLSGLVQGIALIGANRAPQLWLQLLSVVLSIVVGVLFIRDPAVAVGTLALLLIVFLMAEGISKVVMSLTIRPFPNWGWVLTSGAVGILLSLYLISRPATALWLLGVLVGIQLIGEGLAIFGMTRAARRTRAASRGATPA